MIFLSFITFLTSKYHFHWSKHLHKIELKNDQFEVKHAVFDKLSRLRWLISNDQDNDSNKLNLRVCWLKYDWEAERTIWIYIINFKRCCLLIQLICKYKNKEFKWEWETEAEDAEENIYISNDEMRETNQWNE